MNKKFTTLQAFQESFLSDLKQSKYIKKFYRNGKIFIRLLDFNKDKNFDWIFNYSDYINFIKPLLK